METAEAVPSTEPRLTAAKATLILFASVAAETVVFLMYAGAARSQYHEVRLQLIAAMSPVAFTVSKLCGGVVMLLLSCGLFRNSLHDNSVTGAAWILGTRQGSIRGFGMGLLAGWAYIGLAAVSNQWLRLHTPGPITTMGAKGGLSSVLWVLLVLVLAPLTEEPLFRGVLYGGFRRSFGGLKAAILTTLLFVLLHGTEIVYFWPAVIGVTAMAVLTLWLRLRWASIGPSMAAHFGYNTVMVLALLSSPRSI